MTPVSLFSAFKRLGWITVFFLFSFSLSLFLLRTFGLRRSYWPSPLMQQFPLKEKFIILRGGRADLAPSHSKKAIKAALKDPHVFLALDLYFQPHLSKWVLHHSPYLSNVSNVSENTSGRSLEFKDSRSTSSLLSFRELLPLMAKNRPFFLRLHSQDPKALNLFLREIGYQKSSLYQDNNFHYYHNSYLKNGSQSQKRSIQKGKKSEGEKEMGKKEDLQGHLLHSFIIESPFARTFQFFKKQGSHFTFVSHSSTLTQFFLMTSLFIETIYQYNADFFFLSPKDIPPRRMMKEVKRRHQKMVLRVRSFQTWETFPLKDFLDGVLIEHPKTFLASCGLSSSSQPLTFRRLVSFCSKREN